MKKNKIWKRAGAVILSITLLFGILPTGAMAEEISGQVLDNEEKEMTSENVENVEGVVSEISESEEMKSAQVTDENVDGVCGEKNPDSEQEVPSQYHFVEGDIESILNWKEKYLYKRF